MYSIFNNKNDLFRINEIKYIYNIGDLNNPHKI